MFHHQEQPKSQQALPYQTLFYNNTVDHLAPLNEQPRTTFEHRYLLNDDYFGNNPKYSHHSCPGPIFLYAGNEAAITGFWEGNGFMHYLAKKYGGLLVFPEERYYGTSWPTPDCCEFLSTEQVLEDYVELLAHVKQNYGAESCPTIVFGGSYGGTLAAYMRLAYPDVVQGALAASSELGYYDIDGWSERNITYYTFAEVVQAQYSKYDGCFEAIERATQEIDAATNTNILQTFNFCDDSALEPYPSSIFSYGLEGLPQSNYPYPIGHLPAWPVQHVCEILTNNEIPLLERAVMVTSITMNYPLNDLSKCLQTPGEGGPGNVPGDGPGQGSWGYQSCTETLHAFSSTMGRGIRTFNLTAEEDRLMRICRDLYGKIPNTTTLVDRFAGFDIASQTSKTIFSSGALDPWGGAAVTARDGGEDASQRGVHFFRMKNGAHHLDLKGWHKDDPPDVTKVRKQEEVIIMDWIDDWYNHNQHYSNHYYGGANRVQEPKTKERLA